jgi:hypothetical protein
MGARAQRFAQANRGAVDRFMDAIAGYLEG